MMPTPRRPGPRGATGRSGPEAGFTLLELVAVMAIFAMIAVMSVQALQATMRGQTLLVARDADNAELAVALARLRHDLEAAAPFAFLSPRGASEPPLTLRPGGAFALSLAGQPWFEAEQSAGQARVEWQVEEGVLTRRLWPTLIPARTAPVPPAIPVLAGVTALTVTEIDPAPQAGAAPALPRGLSLTLDTERWGRLTLSQAF